MTAKARAKELCINSQSPRITLHPPRVRTCRSHLVVNIHPKTIPIQIKARFLHPFRLGRNEHVTRLYQKVMARKFPPTLPPHPIPKLPSSLLDQEEATVGRTLTIQNRNNLTPQTQADPRLSKGPFSSSMITESARHREIIDVYKKVSTETKAWYDRAVTHDSTWDNWMVRWCLWHAFRYRDERNRSLGPSK